MDGCHRDILIGIVCVCENMTNDQSRQMHSICSPESMVESIDAANAPLHSPNYVEHTKRPTFIINIDGGTFQCDTDHYVRATEFGPT